MLYQYRKSGACNIYSYESLDSYWMVHDMRNVIFKEGSSWEVRKPKAENNKQDQAEKLY